MSDSRKAVVLVALDISTCSLTYGSAPCTASVPTTGADKCTNAPGSCQDTANYTNSDVTLLFAMDTWYTPRDLGTIIPCVVSVDHTPGRVSLGEDLGDRSMLKVLLRDHKHSDVGAGFDKYFATRSYNPYEQGTLFGKFRKRQPYLRGRALRWYQGFEGDALAEMEVRHFLVDSVDGPDENGIYTIIGKDVLKLLDGDRAQAPTLSSGYLDNDINDTDLTLDLLPIGAGADYGTGFIDGVQQYVCIGGSEVCSYYRDPQGDINALRAVLGCHMNGVNGGTSFPDWTNGGKTITANGNAEVRTAQAKHTFATNSASLFCDGTGDFLSIPDSADFNLTTDFVIDCWVRPTALNGGRVFSQESSTTVGYRMSVSATGVVNFILNDTSTLITLSSAAGAVATGTWTHLAIERYGNIWTLFVNGVAVDTTTSAPSVPNVAASFRIGAGSAGANGWTGYIDEFRMLRGSGAAVYQGAAFTPPTEQYTLSSDQLIVIRGRLGTDAASHDSEDRVQLVLRYVTEDPAVIISDLEQTYAGVPSAYIDDAAWQAETAAYYGQVMTVTVTEPTPVKDLVREIIEQAGLAHWEDDTAPALKLRVIRGVSGSDTYSERERLDGTLTIKDQPEKRISRVQVFYGQKDPTKSVSDADNYRSSVMVIDDEAEANYGNVVIKTIYSRWIPQFGGAIAERIGDILLARYRDAPRLFSFRVMRSEVNPILGSGYYLSDYNRLQDEYGASSPAPIQVTRLVAGPADFEIEAEEMLSVDAVSSDPNIHTVTIDSNTNNFNLRTQHDALYGEPVAGNIINCIISAGAIVGATNASNYAFDQGTFPGTVTVTLEVNGRIQGAGGDGGRGGFLPAGGSSSGQIDPEDGDPGGTALKVRSTLALSGSGEIWGGAGGGGGGAPSVNASNDSIGGGGGGGQGRIAGDGAAARKTGNPGNNATTEIYGTGGSGKNSGKAGGRGGAEGSAGVDGVDDAVSGINGGTGGAAGKAIEGDSFITETGTLDVAGART